MTLTLNPLRAFATYANLPISDGTIEDVTTGDIFGYAYHHLGFTAFGNVQHESIHNFQPIWAATYRSFMGVTLLCNTTLKVEQYYAMVPIIFNRSFSCRIIKKENISIDKILARMWIRVHLLRVLRERYRHIPRYTVGR
jgi:hypothetical protein